MARTALTPQNVVSGGLAVSYASGDNTNGMSVPWSPRTFLVLKNTTGGAVVYTFPNPSIVDGQAVASKTVSVPATTGERIVGPFPGSYAQADGSLYLDIAATGTTVAALVLPATG